MEWPGWQMAIWAGAVSKAGGLGIIGGGNAPKEVVKANIDKIKSLTDKPFGVNIMLLSPFVDDIVDLVIEEGVKVVTTGAGNPSKYMERFHEAGITVIPVVPSVAWLNVWKKSVQMLLFVKVWKPVDTLVN